MSNPRVNRVSSSEGTVPGAPVFHRAEGDLDPSARASLDDALETLRAHQGEWKDLPIGDRIAIVEDTLASMTSMGDEWVAANMQAKGLARGTYAAGEEWTIYSMGLRAIRGYRDSLNSIERTGRPEIAGGLRLDDDGRVQARVFPATLLDRLLFIGVTADVSMLPGATPESVLEHMAWAYQPGNTEGGLAVVLAAGNLSILPLLDSLNMLLVKKHVVLLKINPVNEYMAPILERALQPLVDGGYLRIVRGGPESGDYLTHHPDVDAIHLTGSDKTFEAIVFGRGEEGKRRLETGQSVNGKKITAELGNVTPLIIVPGPWRQEDIRYKATELASWLAINASFNCLSPRIIIQHAEWPLRDAFLAALGEALDAIPTRQAYYPGAQSRHQHFVESHSGVRQFGEPEPGELPWTLIADIDPSKSDDIAFRNEAFCSVLSECAISAPTTEAFIQQAVKFANESLWGTLVVSLYVHPRSLADPSVAQAVERAIADLHYGTVCLNLRGEFGYFPLVAPWGGYPGSPDTNIQSGRGVIHNPLMFADSQKSVVRGPFRQFPNPFLATSNRLYGFGIRLARFEARPSLLRLPGVLWSALVG